MSFSGPAPGGRSAGALHPSGCECGDREGRRAPQQQDQYVARQRTDLTIEDPVSEAVCGPSDREDLVQRLERPGRRVDRHQSAEGHQLESRETDGQHPSPASASDGDERLATACQGGARSAADPVPGPRIVC